VAENNTVDEATAKLLTADKTQRSPPMLKRFSLSAVTVLCLTTTAWSQATQPEADRIKAAIEKYVGKDTGAITVTTTGDKYELKFDANALWKKFAAAFTAEMPAIIYTLTPQADKKWLVETNTPITMKMKTALGDEISYSADSVFTQYLFDEANLANLDGKFSAKNYASNQSQTDPNTQTSFQVTSKAASIDGTLSGKVISPGVADQGMNFNLSGLSQELRFGGQPVANISPVQLSMASEKGNYTIDLKSARTVGIFDLVAWTVAHSDKQLAINDQQGMKNAIRAALPLWDQFNSTYTFNNVQITSPVGPFQLAKFGGTGNVSGLNKVANLQVATSLNGLSVPPGLLPAWSNDIMLKDMVLDFSVSGWNAEEGMTFLLDKLDLQKDPPISDAQWLEAVTKFAPNPIKFSINPSKLVGGASTISFTGDFNYANQKFSGTSKITAEGFDAMMEKIQIAAESDPMAKQVWTGMIGAKGLGKADGKGGYAWELVASEDGKVTVNGVDVSKMSGNP
jgi:hypothetical protein